MKQIKKILIANRSEVASRIISTCKALNIKTVAIYSDEDKFLEYVFQADENYALEKIGGSAYLEQDEILQIAKKLNVDAIHPGYGFLSENYIFAQKVIDNKIIWIGPNPKIIKSMADKINARNIMGKNGEPIIPGYFITHNEEEESIKKKGTEIGLPIILKDPLGGGGKGIKKVFSIQELMPAINSIKSQTSRTTKSTQILMEKYIDQARHIEIQIAGDGKNFVHLYERECSIQRKHQKIIEETPAYFVSKNILNKMYQAAMNAAKIINYDNIGTVEFILTKNEFYFLEINTRLQVEHSITEQTTGIDLVDLQIKLAETKKLNLKQNKIEQTNHSIECRIYSEDPENNFLPSTGKISNLNFSKNPYIRIDHNLNKNINISSFYDPMLAKITATGQSREKTIQNMIAYLEQININGIKTNINFLKQILKSNEFISGNIHTQLLEEKNYLDQNPFNPNPFDQNPLNYEKEIAIIIAASLTQISHDQKSENKINTTNHWKEQQWR